MAGYPLPMMSIGDLAFKRDELSDVESDVREKSATLASLRSARERIAVSSNVRLHYVDIADGIRAEFEAPADLALIWIDREIASAKVALRKALIALREYAVRQSDAL